MLIDFLYIGELKGGAGLMDLVKFLEIDIGEFFGYVDYAAC